MANRWGVEIGASWRMQLNDLRAAAMRPFTKLLWPLVCIDLFVFRLNVPMSCSFNVRLFTRERKQSLSSAVNQFFDETDDRLGRGHAAPGRGDSWPSGYGCKIRLYKHYKRFTNLKNTFNKI